MKILKILKIVLLLFVALPLYGQDITLEDLYEKNTFSAKGIQQMRSVGDGYYATYTKEGITLRKYADEDYKKILLDSLVYDGKKIKFSNYQFSGERDKILLSANVELIYRHSYKADYYLVDIKTNENYYLTDKGKVQEITFSPKGDKLAYVRENNLFVFNLETKKETQLTSDGEFTKIINGLPDWVYEEEFGFSRAYAWSPDGEQIAYMKFDETEVPTYSLQFYGNGKSYPDLYTYKYPKAGEKNATVSVWVYDLNTAKNTELNVNKGSEQYIPRIKWTKGEHELMILRLNRHQNNLEYLIVNTQNNIVKTVFIEKNKYYVDATNFDALTFLNKDEFAFLTELSGYNNLYKYNYKTRTLTPWLKKDWDITAFYGVDKKGNAYLQVANQKPYNRAICKVDKHGKLLFLTEDEAYHNARFDKDFKFWIHSYSSTKKAPIYEVKSTQNNISYILENNNELQRKWDSMDLPEKEFIELPSAEDTVKLSAWRILPKDFDQSKKYPAFITQYSGPNSQQVKNTFGVSWYDYLAQEGFIVYCVDSRGTAARGEYFRKQTYMQLGKLESEDMIAVGRHLQSLPYVKANDITIWGWSYGGFMSTLCLMKGGDVFTSAIAVAPVIHWKFYDSVYTERYMRTPQENPDGYDNNSPLENVDKLKTNKNLLLVHGTADDNVHVQNTYALTHKMVAKDIPFDMHIYTDKNHSIYGGKTRLHLYKKFMEFLKERKLTNH
ncbi:dipeptidyl-peptidase-4 [Balneicella halophila]|uniref:Dipeptidyl-peptidase-4 n=1 Tax=Balneicella halophila TaxID=1537566 RepID=A0A7L4UQE2_BALHA|nr:S9 family peptidase [Balneicella halophila]PVX49960.1 dipeptidyl-peptidase-4 [Balneicella halophila]